MKTVRRFQQVATLPILVLSFIASSAGQDTARSNQISIPVVDQDCGPSLPVTCISAPSAVRAERQAADAKLASARPDAAASKNDNATTDFLEAALVSQGTPDAPSYTLVKNVDRPAVMTGSEKFKVFVEQSHSPLTFIAAGIETGLIDPGGYGPGIGGVGKRYAAAMAGQESAIFLKHFLMPYLLKQDPRYHMSKDTSVVKRAVYAVSRVIFTRTDAGEEAINTSYIAGTVLSEAVSNRYLRDPMTGGLHHMNRGWGSTFARAGASIGSDMGMNVFHEFWPGIQNKLFGSTIKKLEKFKGKNVDPTLAAIEKQHRD